MRIVIDANIFLAFYMEAALEKDGALTGSALSLFKRLGRSDTAYVDSEDHIEQEWRDLVEPEWFERWFQAQLTAGTIEIIAAVKARECLRKLRVDCGFSGQESPWYVRTSSAVAQAYSEPAGLITEDLDFFEPKAKGCAPGRRRRILMSGTGSVARYLAKREDVLVRCVAVHLATP